MPKTTHSAIEQLYPSGERKAIFPSLNRMAEALFEEGKTPAKNTLRQRVGRAIKNNETYLGFLWRKCTNIEASCTRQVHQYDLRRNYIASFPSLAEAARQTGTNSGHISSVCQGKRGSAGSGNGTRYLWSYAFLDSEPTKILQPFEDRAPVISAEEEAKMQEHIRRKPVRRITNNFVCLETTGTMAVPSVVPPSIAKHGGEWRDLTYIINKPGYWISDRGEMRSCSRRDPLKMSETASGYLRNAYGSAHCLVAKAFLPNPRELTEVNHKDFDKGNNMVRNLEWSTRRENMKHSAEGPAVNSSAPIPPLDITLDRRIVKYKNKQYLVYENSAICTVDTGKQLPFYFASPADTTFYRCKLGLVHDVVAKAFCEKPKEIPAENLFVTHIDGNDHNNHAGNLKWVTRKESWDLAVKLGRRQRRRNQ